MIYSLVILTALLSQTDIGQSEPPYTEATVSMPVKQLKDGEKRCEVMQDLADQSGMNYRLLCMRFAEKWQNTIKQDKTFLKNLQKCKTIEFTVKKDGRLIIEGKEDPKKKKKEQ